MPAAAAVTAGNSAACSSPKMKSVSGTTPVSLSTRLYVAMSQARTAGGQPARSAAVRRGHQPPQ
jgi:hypothetical protein